MGRVVYSEFPPLRAPCTMHHKGRMPRGSKEGCSHLLINARDTRRTWDCKGYKLDIANTVRAVARFAPIDRSWAVPDGAIVRTCCGLLGHYPTVPGDKMSPTCQGDQSAAMSGETGRPHFNKINAWSEMDSPHPTAFTPRSNISKRPQASYARKPSLAGPVSCHISP